MIQSRFVHIATAEALKSVGRYKVGAVIFKGDIFVGKGYYDASANYPGSSTKYPIKAELMAMINSKRTLNGTTLLVIALNRNKKMKNAKPNREIIAWARKMGISDIVYSTSTNFKRVT